MENSGVQEFYEIMQHLRQLPAAKKKTPKFAVADRRLWEGRVTISGTEYNCFVYSLSPSDYSKVLAHQEIASLLPDEKDEKRRVVMRSPNHAAIVIWISIGNNFILLGSDLEETGHAEAGWSGILGSGMYPKGKASIFKIPHHGSSTGDHPEVWSEMLDTTPFAILTPFVRGKVLLPKKADVARICGRTENAFATAIPSHKKSVKREKAVDREIKKAATSINPVFYSTGHLRLRAKIAEAPLSWELELFGGALPLKSIYTT
jgi:hypothetical protein